MPDPRVLVVGEALVDVVHTADGTATEHVGGSPANVAAGLARLGHEVVLATHTGDDDRGRRVTAHLRDHGVGLATGPTAERTTTATARLDAAGSASYEFDLTWDLPVLPLDGVDHVHTGSLAATVEPGATAVLELLVRAREVATVSYDPNVRPAVMGDAHGVRSRIEECIGRSDVVKASAEDVAWLYAGAPVAEVAHLWGRLGPGLVVITLGGDGALVHLSGEDTERHHQAEPVRVVDTVGAGDAFMAGLLSGLFDTGLAGHPEARRRLTGARHDAVAPAVERALASAAWTVRRAGAAAATRADLAGSADR